MRTNIVLDDRLVNMALKISKLHTKKDLVVTALMEYVQNHSRLNLKELKGKISFRKDYDYKALRKG